MKKEYFFLLLIFVFGVIIRFASVWPSNTIIGFDQARDLFDSLSILHGNIKVIGPTAGNNPNLHHGVAWVYFMIPALIFSKNPIYTVLWNSIFNASAGVAVYFISKSLFGNKKVGYIAAILTSVSYYFVQFSGWLSNPTGTMFTLPFFILGITEYYKGKKWGLPLATFMLGLTIQFELFFLYLVPASIVIWFILKPKMPSLKLALISLISLTVSISTMIATEIKFGFLGVKSIATSGQLVGGDKTSLLENIIYFLKERWETFYLNFWPQNKEIGTIIGVLAIAFIVYEVVKNLKSKNKEIIKADLVLLVLFFSPAIMFILGKHNAPWFYIGRPLFAILIGSYILSKIKSKFLISALMLLIIFANLTAIKDSYGKGQILLEPDNASILSTQVLAMKYTYEKADGEKFAIDTVTNPLYVNAVWAWNYNWYYKEYGYKPTWLGGDQIPPYNTLQNSDGKERYFFLIIDKTDRIPPVYKENAVNSLKKRAHLVEEKEFNGIKVSMWQNSNQTSNSQIPKK